MTTAATGKIVEKATKHVCPICRTDMKLLPGTFKFDYEIEGMKKFTTPESVYVCPSCGNVQQFVELPDVRPLLAD